MEDVEAFAARAVAAMDDEALVAECTRRLTDLDARCRAALGPPFAAR